MVGHLSIKAGGIMKVNHEWLISFASGLIILLYTFFITFIPMQEQIQKLQSQNMRLQEEIKIHKQRFNHPETGLNSEAFYAWFQENHFSQLQLQSFSETTTGLHLKISGSSAVLMDFLSLVQKSNFTHLALLNLQTSRAVLEIDLAQAHVTQKLIIPPANKSKTQKADLPPAPSSFSSIPTTTIGRIKKNGTCFLVNTVGEKTIMRKTEKC